MLKNLTHSVAALSCVLLLGLAGCSDSGAEGSTNTAGDGASDQSNATIGPSLTETVVNQNRTVSPNLAQAVSDTSRQVQTTRPTQPTVSGDSTELIVIAEPISLDLGSIGTGQQAKGIVRLINTGDRPMRVINCKANCGCTTTNCPRNKELQPGESVEVQVQMKAGLIGGRRQSKRVDFIVEGQPVLRVPVFVNVVAYVEIEPRNIDLQQTTDGRVVIRSLDDQPFRVLSMNPPWIEAFDGEARTEHVVYLPLDDLQAQSRVRKIDFTIDHPETNKVSVALRRARRTPGDTSRTAARRSAATIDIALAGAARSGDVAAIGQAIKDGKNLELLDEQGATLLGIAARAKQAEVVRVLLEGGAKIDTPNRRGFTPLVAAIQTRQSSVQVVQVLIEKGADVNLRDTTPIGGTPLSWAAGPFSNPEIVAALVAANADVNQANNKGMTPLMWAARYGAPGTVKVLVDAGADVSAKMPNGQTALDLARQRRESADAAQVVELLADQATSTADEN